MSRLVTFRVIREYVSDALSEIFLSVSNDGKNKTGFLIDAASKIVEAECDVSFCGSIDAATFIPLILCDERESLKQKGIACPYEFVIERKDLIPSVNADGTFASDPVEIMATRLSVLARLYGGYNFMDASQDWFAGAFRIYMMLDATTHGTSDFVDPQRGKDDPILKAASEMDAAYKPPETCTDEVQALAVRLKDRFCGNPDADVKAFGELAQRIFKERFARIQNAFTTINDSERRLKELVAIYTDTERWPECCDKNNQDRAGWPRSHKERLPVAFGDRAKHVTPTGKLNLLLIDDNVDKSPFYYLAKSDKPSCDKDNLKFDFSSTISNDDWTLLCDIFNVQTMSVDQKDGDIYKTAVRRFREFHNKGLTFDLILVDLCLGNNRQGADLDGYAMIRIARVFFPGTPIVVYSRFSDMEHIARAFFSGAKWFLVKGEEAKLPRHVLKLLKQVGWHREWQSVKTSSHAPKFLYDKTDGFSRRFDRTEQWKYLTYKSLEYFPGKFITVKKMGGGISSAVTFKATKGVKLGEDFLQTPCIIKIDTSYNTMMEFERYFRMIRPYIANECGRVEMPERVLNRTYSSIVYTFAGKQDQAHELVSMGDMLDDDIVCETACDYKTYRYALQCIFDEILPKVHRVSPELEFADIGKSSASPTEVMDAFAWKDDPVRKSSFPNYYFCEFEPSEFWKSYMLRMQPWGRMPIKFGMENGCNVWPFSLQQCTETQKKLKRLIFHNIITDPFAKLDRYSGDHVAGSKVIEAYTADRKLVWLEGDVCDFVARFRKRVSPGMSLWFDNLDVIDEDGNLSVEKKDEQGKIIKQGMPDGRVHWLEDMFESNSQKRPTAKADFCLAISRLTNIDRCLNDNLKFYVDLQDKLMLIAEAAARKAKEWDMKCPVGIVHGDLNVKNIMLESRKHPPKDDDPDVTKSVSDVWFIDFARTRRDLIAHDFNVFFTSVLGELFTESLIGKEGRGKSARQDKYWDKLIANFKVIVSNAVAPNSKNEKSVPDEVKDDRRFTLIYRILRRTHDAAKAAGVSQNMYLLTTALACLYTLKIFLNNGCKVRLAAGYFAAAWICYDLLCMAIDEKNEMEVYKKTS